MERIVTNMDQHGRVLIPVSIRERFNIHPGEKITIEIENSEIKIVSVDSIIDEMHNIFTKNQIDKNISIVDDFIAERRQEYLIEEKRSKRCPK